jgi:hypothetical protein
MIFSNVIPDRLLDAVRPASWTRTWSVGAQPDADFGTIQEALLRAQPGDVVEVQPGRYELPVAVPAGVHLQSVRPREAILQSPTEAIAPHTPALTLAGRSRVAGFKIDAAGLATGVLAAEDEPEMEDLEIVGTTNAAVLFGPGSRGVLRSSYVHDNAGTGVVVEAQALPRLLHNVITANGRKGVTPGPRGQANTPAGPSAPGIVLQPGATAVFFGNIVAGNAEDQIAGLAGDRRADVVRDNVIGLAARAPAVARPPAAPSTPRPAR